MTQLTKYLVILGFFFGAQIALAADPQPFITLKAMIVNPNETEAQKVPVELPLPREASKKHVIDLPEGMEIRYDSEQGLYKAVGEMTLGPGEQKSVQVNIQDVWRIPEKEIQFQQGYLKVLMKLLSEGRYADTANNLDESIRSRLDNILVSQRETVAPSKHMENYRDNLVTFDQAKKDVGFLEKIASEKVDLPAALLEAESAYLGKGHNSEEVKTIILNVMVKNPSSTDKALLPLDYYLPRGVREKDVIDAGELEPRTDPNRGEVFLHKDEIPLEAGASKMYKVTLRDLWHIDPKVIRDLDVKAVAMAQGMKGSKFESASQNMKNTVLRMSEEIQQTQTDAQGKPVEEHVAAFVENFTLLEEMKEKVTKMAKVQTVAMISPKTSPKDLGLEQSKDETTEEVVPESPDLIARAMFKDKSPDKKTLWRVIFAIVGFLGFLSLLFYVLWWTQTKIAAEATKEEIQ